MSRGFDNIRSKLNIPISNYPRGVIFFYSLKQIVGTFNYPNSRIYTQIWCICTRKDRRSLINICAAMQ